MDLGPAKAVLGRQTFWNDHVAAVGSVGGVPASGAAVMRHVLDRAASAFGERPTVLHATDAGRPVYERMGYTPTSTHMLYMDAALLGGH